MLLYKKRNTVTMMIHLLNRKSLAVILQGFGIVNQVILLLFSAVGCLCFNGAGIGFFGR